MADTKSKTSPQRDTAVELDVLKGTLGQDVIDIRTLSVPKVCSPLTRFTSTHPANLKLLLLMVMKLFCCTAVSRSISWRPILTTEVCYILLNGENRLQEQYDEFKTTVTRHTMIHEQITRLFHAFRRDSHPMAVMCYYRRAGSVLSRLAGC